MTPFEDRDETARRVDRLFWVTAALILCLAFVPAYIGWVLQGHKVPVREEGTISLRAIDINSATASVLEGLPGIGPVIAGRIVAQREFGPYATVSDLGRVKGIGPAKLTAIEPYIFVGNIVISNSYAR